ncbi:Protein ZBED8 [Thelohanellus kitauei]|uniref:Protein ZBED8 n=1 Tax=Thelohanellus kitauei TaxID=669202 RepID=A0A0C2MKQ8_THEKT|nr:Protein ZBED8 [Thelohanellus kitauei]
MKPHTKADELLLSTAKYIVGVMIGEEYVKKLNGIYISLDAVFRRIADIFADILDQMIQEMKSSTLPIFGIQLDESTDVENGSQLLMYGRYIYDSVFKTRFSSVNVWTQLLSHEIYMKKFVHFYKSIKSHGKISVACAQMVL